MPLNNDNRFEEFTRQTECLVLAGQLAQARQLCRKTLHKHPHQAQPHYMLGVVCMQEANPQEASTHLRKALTYAPDDVEVRFAFAVALQTIGALAEAVEQVEIALCLAPEDADLHRLRGNILLALGRKAESEASFRTAAHHEQAEPPQSETQLLAVPPASSAPVQPAVSPQHEQMLRSALRCLEEGKIHQAERELRALLAQTPEWAEAHRWLADTLLNQDRIPEAEAGYRTAIALDSRQIDYRIRLGGVLGLQCKLEEAEVVYRQALTLPGSAPQLKCHLGMILALRGELAAAEEQCRQGLREAGDSYPCLIDTALVASLQGRYEETQALLERAVMLAPDDPRGHLNLATLLLKRGDFARGWAEYEWRTRVRSARRPMNSVRWDGSFQPNKTLLVHAEQGIGDTIQFIRFLPLARSRVGQVIFQHPPELTALLQGLPGCDALIAQSTAPSPSEPPHDLHISLLSLPFVLGIGAEIPAQSTYLEADALQVERWQRHLGSDPALKVGIVWAGNPRHMIDRLRSTALAHFTLLGDVPGVHYYSLQKGDAARQAQAPPAGMAFTDLGPDLHDFADTAAAIMNLDLVITVDTSIAHLAGALGKPTWVLLPYDPDWRWLLDREDTPGIPAHVCSASRNLETGTRSCSASQANFDRWQTVRSRRARRRRRRWCDRDRSGYSRAGLRQRRRCWSGRWL